MSVFTKLKEKVRKDARLSGLLWGIRGLWGDTPATVSERYYKPRTRPIIDAYLNSRLPRKLHIGAQAHVLEEWLNVDIYTGASPGVAYMDATKKFPFEDNSFDYIFSEHMIEHVDHAQGNFMLSECFRVLNPQGKIRIATPDLDRLMALPLFDGSGKDYFDDLVRPGFESKGIPIEPNIGYVLNYIMHNFGHRFVYNRTTLLNIMKVNGFVYLGDYSPGESDDDVFRKIEGHSRTGNPLCDLETMNMEAYKPSL
jgi:SAM-dependent methyltransferase